MLVPLIAAALAVSAPPKKLIMAHYMPWFAAKPVSKEWGWHWTMGKLNPDELRNGKRVAATHYTPLIGLYDSGDPDVVECQTLLMKIAGIDGVFVDWYGTVDHYDYAINHRNTLRMFDAMRGAGMKFGLVYEDQTVPQLIKGGKIREEEATESGRDLMRWVDRNWFSSPTYVRQDGKPVFLVFGPQYYKSEAWTGMFEGLSNPPAFFSLHHRRPPAAGAYDWPLPKGGEEGSRKERGAFFERAKEWPFISVAYPRFRDFYKEAGLHDSYGRIEDREGKTFEETLTESLRSPANIVQIATWNDWGEGTMIEPSVEFGYRDLEATQRLRRRFVDPSFRFLAADLRLPLRLLELRRKGVSVAGPVAAKLRAGDVQGARALLEAVR